MSTPNLLSPHLSRRQVLGASAALLMPALASAKFDHPLGAELYTVRADLPKDPDRVLKAIAEMGYKEVEGSRADSVSMTAKFKEYGLKPVSCHAEQGLITGNWGKQPVPAGLTLESAIDGAKAAGVHYFVMPYLPPDQRTDADGYKSLCDKMNHAAMLCKKVGMEFAYHNHAFEFGGKPGERPIDIFKARLDPKLVALEMDVFWVSVAGHDPVEMLNEWKGRVSMLHLKDKPKDLAVMYNEGVPRTTFKEVGAGSLDFKAILAAAPKAGVKHYFVEQDQTPGDALASLKKSIDYLKTV